MNAPGKLPAVLQKEKGEAILSRLILKETRMMDASPVVFAVFGRISAKITGKTADFWKFLKNLVLIRFCIPSWDCRPCA